MTHAHQSTVQKTETKTPAAESKSRVSTQPKTTPAWTNALGSQPALTLQPKLTVNQPGDEYEEEADRVAAQIMRMATPAVTQVQRCACGGVAGPDGECAACKAKRLALQRKADGIAHTEAPPSVHQTIHSSGQPLDTSTRAFMEPRFGQDFSSVRVHTDSQAAQSAADVSARAYTVGNNIVFGAGQYAPGNDIGKQLIAHELAHTVQQINSSDTATMQPRLQNNQAINRMLQREGTDDKDLPKQGEETKREDYVFIMGTDPKGNPNQFYKIAERYFRAEVPAAHIVTSTRSLDAMLRYITTNISKPIGNLYVVSHGNEDGTLGFALDSSDLPQKGKRPSNGHGDGRLSPDELRKVLHPSDDQSNTLTQLDGQIDEQTTIRIRGCNIGQNEEMVNLIDEAFGGKGTVTAPTHEQRYFSKSVTKGQKSAQTYYGALSGPILQRPGNNLFSKDEIKEIVEEHYAHLPPKRRNQLVNDLLKGQSRQNKVPYTFTTVKVPTTSSEARSRFKRDFKAQTFKPDPRKPVKITEQEEDGKLKYIYEFEGTSGTGKNKEQSSLVFNLTFDKPPADSDLEAQAKQDFPNPEDYLWRVEHKNLVIKVVAERVFVRLQHKSLNSDQPFDPEESDPFFYTTSEAE